MFGYSCSCVLSVGANSSIEYQRELRDFAHEHHLLGRPGAAAAADVQRVGRGRVAAASAR